MVPRSLMGEDVRAISNASQSQLISQSQDFADWPTPPSPSTSTTPTKLAPSESYLRSLRRTSRSSSLLSYNAEEESKTTNEQETELKDVQKKDKAEEEDD